MDAHTALIVIAIVIIVIVSILIVFRRPGKSKIHTDVDLWGARVTLHGTSESAVAPDGQPEGDHGDGSERTAVQTQGGPTPSLLPPQPSSPPATPLPASFWDLLEADLARLCPDVDQLLIVLKKAGFDTSACPHGVPDKRIYHVIRHELEVGYDPVDQERIIAALSRYRPGSLAFRTGTQ